MIWKRNSRRCSYDPVCSAEVENAWYHHCAGSGLWARRILGCGRKFVCAMQSSCGVAERSRRGRSDIFEPERGDDPWMAGGECDESRGGDFTAWCACG